MRRAGYTGQLADLDMGIAYFQAADHAVTDHDPDRLIYLDNIGVALSARFERTGDQSNLDEAISIHQETVGSSAADDPDRARYLANLGASLGKRGQLTGDTANMAQAVACLRDAIAATPADDPGYRDRLSNFGVLLLTAFEVTGQPADLDEAIDCLRRVANATAASHPDRSAYLDNLGRALRKRFEHGTQMADLEQAIEAYREGARIPAAQPRWRLEAARQWGQCAMLAGLPETAAEAYKAAMELLPLTAWHGLDQAAREYHLRISAGLAADAAAAMLTTGHPAQAVELLELGRSMLWTQALHLRQDLTELKERAPDMAAALESARDILNSSATGLTKIKERMPEHAAHWEIQRVLDQSSDYAYMTWDAERGGEAGQLILEDRQQAAREWDATVEQVRKIPGFEHFLRPASFADLRTAGDGGPVVIVNVSLHGSHALLLSPHAGQGSESAPSVVPLPDAPIGAATEQSEILRSALRRISDPAAGWQDREADRHAVFDVLTWCWEAIAQPVLAALGFTETPQGRVEDWPRVWWCPTGAAAGLPLHAAGVHPRTTFQYRRMGDETATADSVAGRVISSYTPTLSALVHARIRSASDQVRQLAVGMPEAPSYAPNTTPLPAVNSEFQVLASGLPEPDHATHLLGPAATHGAVMTALPNHSWLHLSCHAFQHRDPLLSAFLLHDQPLTLADLARLDLRETGLAYLAACQTASGDPDLADEALHLAGAMRMIGFRHVLAAMWSISDPVAPAIADMIYAHLLHTDPDHPSPVDRPEAARTSYALHHAVTHLRQAFPDQPLLWAPYIHLGP